MCVFYIEGLPRESAVVTQHSIDIRSALLTQQSIGIRSASGDSSYLPHSVVTADLN
jgi:hypothetical protein